MRGRAGWIATRFMRKRGVISFMLNKGGRRVWEFSAQLQNNVYVDSGRRNVLGLFELIPHVFRIE